MTIRDTLRAALLKKGWVEDTKNVSRNYEKYIPPANFGHANSRIFLGKHGSLRFGQSYRFSRPWDKMKNDLLKESVCEP
jgi:hypothetical protein